MLRPNGTPQYSRDSRQLQPSPPAAGELLPKRRVFGPGEGGVLLHDGEGLSARLLQEPPVAQDVGDAEVGDSRLARAEEVAGAADREVLLGDPEAVAALGHDPEAAF